MFQDEDTLCAKI
jgi:hypothetical protein